MRDINKHTRVEMWKITTSWRSVSSVAGQGTWQRLVQTPQKAFWGFWQPFFGQAANPVTGDLVRFYTEDADAQHKIFPDFWSNKCFYL